MTTTLELASMRLIAPPRDAGSFAPFGTVSPAPLPDGRVRISPAVNRHPGPSRGWRP